MHGGKQSEHNPVSRVTKAGASVLLERVTAKAIQHDDGLGFAS